MCPGCFPAISPDLVSRDLSYSTIKGHMRGNMSSNNKDFRGEASLDVQRMKYCATAAEIHMQYLSNEC